MKSYFESMSNSFVYCGQKIFDFLLISVLWVFSSIPIITIGASTTALYDTIHKAFVQEEGYICKTYFQSFRKNCKQAIALWIFFIFIRVILRFNAALFIAYTESDFGGIMSAFYECIAILMFAIFIYQAATLSRFQMPVGWFVKISFYMAFRHLVKSLLLIILVVFSLYLFFYMPLLIFILPSFVGVCAEKLIEPVLQKHMPVKYKTNKN